MHISALTPPGLNYRLTAPSLPDTPRVARDWVASLLRSFGWPEWAEAARLCTSEVVTNAHQHTGSARIAVEVAFADGRVTVAVHDGAPGARLPDRPPGGGGLLDLRGRGLALVAAYADAWAVAEEADGKAVWFSFGRGPDRAGPQSTATGATGVPTAPTRGSGMADSQNA